MNKYAIWNKQDLILTPIGEVLTPDQWIERYPIAGVPTVTVVCAAGEINGGFFGTLSQMVEMYETDGCDFTGCETPEDKINRINRYEIERDVKMKAEAAAEAERKAYNEELNAMSMASIAAQLEYQNMMTLDDVEEE
jgi:hypothetical protein